MSPMVIISFFAGAGVGVGGSYFVLKKHYEKVTAKEIAEMREYANECKKYGDDMKRYADEMYELMTGKEMPEKGFTREEMIDYISSEELKIAESGQKSPIIDKINRRKEENEIKSIEECYNDIQDALKDSMLNQENEEIKSIEEAYDDIQDALFEKENSNYLDSLVDYTKYAKDQSAYEHPNEEIGMPRIELITALEYDNSKPMNEKIILNYYQEDDILCYEENEEIIENPEELIGQEALYAFGSPDYDDPDEIFVRNNQRNEDYQIILYESAYSEMVGEY